MPFFSPPLVVIAITEQTSQWFRVPFPSLWKRCCMVNTRSDPSEQAWRRDAETPNHSRSIIFSSQNMDQRGIHLLLSSREPYALSAGGFVKPSCQMDAHTAAPNHTTQTGRDKPAAPVGQETCGPSADVYRTGCTYGVPFMTVIINVWRQRRRWVAYIWHAL